LASGTPSSTLRSSVIGFRGEDRFLRELNPQDFRVIHQDLGDAVATIDHGRRISKRSPRVSLPAEAVATATATLALDPRVKVVIVYRYALLRDLFVRVLSDAGLVIVASIPEKEFFVTSLGDLRPDVIVIDEAASEVLGMISQATLFNSTPGSVSKIITVGADDSIMVVNYKEVIRGAGIGDLISRAQSSQPTR
jgi:hypothetical protein